MTNVTFIGGSFDMTRRVMEVRDRVLRVPKLREVQACYSLPPDVPQMETFQVETYVLRQASADHYVAIYEGLR